MRVLLALRKRIVSIRFRERDLVQLDQLARSLGVPSRSRLVNLALQTFFDSTAKQPLTLGQKRSVKVLLDQPGKERLDEAARRLQTSRTELVRIALEQFAQENRD